MSPYITHISSPSPSGTEEDRRRPNILRRYLDNIALFALFLQVTELYKPIGYLAGLPDSQSVNIAFLAFFSLYLATNISATLALLSSKAVLGWVCVIVVVPTLIMLIQSLGGIVSTSEATYWTGFSLIFAGVFLVAALLWSRKGSRITKPFFIGCIAATWIGFLVNIVDYGFLREVMAFSSNRIAVSESTLRMLGFYSHPNMAAFSLCLYLLFLSGDASFLRSASWIRLLVIGAALAGILLTGSRTSLLLFFLVFFFYLRNLGSLHFVGTRQSINRFVFLPIGLVATGALFYVILTLWVESGSELSSTVMNRIESLVHLTDGSIAKSDESANIRINILSVYISDIYQKPLLGYGPDYAFQQIQSGRFSNVSQNSWVEWTLRSGLVYPLLVASAFIYTYFLNRRTRTDALESRQIAGVLLILLVSTVSLVDILWLRPAACVLGAALGLLFTRRRSSRTGEESATKTKGSTRVEILRSADRAL